MQLKYNPKQAEYDADQPIRKESNPMRALEARQPCLQKPLPSAKFYATTARAKGRSPLTPCAARLPTQALRDRPAGGWTWALPTGNH